MSLLLSCPWIFVANFLEFSSLNIAIVQLLFEKKYGKNCPNFESFFGEKGNINPEVLFAKVEKLQHSDRSSSDQ